MPGNKIRARTNNSFGFTLLELLIVLVILSIIAVTAGVNFRTLTEDQILKKAISDIQSYLRSAQTNSTAGVKCPNTSTSGTWSVVFNSDKTTLGMNCRYNDIVLSNAKPALTLNENAEVYSTTGSGCTDGPPLTVIYSALYGNVTFNSDTNCSVVTITLQRKNTTIRKSFDITKGGAIDVAQ